MSIEGRPALETHRVARRHRPRIDAGGLRLRSGKEERAGRISARPALITDEIRQPKLFGQGVLAVNVEVTGHTGRPGIGLASTDADGVIPLSDDRIAVLGDHAEVAVLQLEMDFLAGAGFEMNALEAAQSDERRALDRREFQVELDDLVARRPCRCWSPSHRRP